MATLVLDTFQAVNKLKTKGFSEEQARGITEALQDIDLDHIATKQDMLLLKQDLQVAMAELKADIFKWPVPLLLGQAALITAMMKLL